MSTLWARTALLPDGWAADVAVEIDPVGRISDVAAGQPPQGHQADILLPAVVNAHSHAFQRAMAGLTERRGQDPADTFWTWRALMYRFLDLLTPEQVQAITAFVQMEMLEAGYATNVEFHYLHHRPGGAPYDDLAEMSGRIVAASAETGIGLTLLPVHYQYGGCDGRELEAGQVRFGNDFNQFERLAEKTRKAISTLLPDATTGIAPHSLRAVGREDLPRLAQLAGDHPIHIHLAEQVAEVDEVKAAWDARPVEWLLDNVTPGPTWCLIHCTQMEPHETEALAATGAIAGLCPITEANLGDGIFDGVRWMAGDGAIAVGSDSNLRISLAEELRMLDHSQRLRDRTRAALASDEASTGRRLFDAVCAGGARAAGRRTGRIAPGYWADLMTLDASHPDLAGQGGDTLLDCFIFAGGDRTIRDVWSAGRHQVRDGRHVAREAITRAYLSAIAPLRSGL